MFSMKPKFNLAEFLAVPAPAGKFRNTRRRAMPFRSNATSEDAGASTQSADPGSTNQPEE
jgi:hypothetical protein